MAATNTPREKDTTKVTEADIPTAIPMVELGTNLIAALVVNGPGVCRYPYLYI